VKIILLDHQNWFLVYFTSLSKQQSILTF